MDVHSLSNAMLLCLGITVLLLGGFACLASLPSGAIIRGGGLIVVQANEIALNGTDYNSTTAQYTPDLGNITITPRMILEYGDFVGTKDVSLSIPPLPISPRIAVEYADYASPMTWILQGHPKTLFIGTPIPPPPSEVQENQSVTVSVNVTGIESPVKNVFLKYTTNNGTSWNNTEMTLSNQYPNSTICLYQATISGQLADTWVNYSISAFDNAGNYADTSARYAVIPEFPSMIVLALFMIVTLVVVIAYRRKRFSLAADERQQGRERSKSYVETSRPSPHYLFPAWIPGGPNEL
jgi:hypothetical protein